METAHVETEVPAKPALPLLALLALASVLGVAVAVVLAALAMLLAAPAYGAEGCLLLERPGGLVEASLLRMESERSEEGSVVRTRIVAAFQNPFDERLAAIYVHRLPPDAVLERLTLRRRLIEDDEVEDRAAEALPAVLVRGAPAAVAERAAEIGPGETLVIELEYRQVPREAPRRPLLAMR